MALKFIGERTVGTLNGMKSGFVKDDLYRVYDAGILVPGGVAVDHGDFVSWDGTKWKLETDIKIARSDEISNTNSSIAPNYTKKTYEANSYVMQGGVLYTNENAIETAEDWNPEHWTQTTVAEMMASAGGGGGYEIIVRSAAFDSDVTFEIPERSVVYINATKSNNTNHTCTLKFLGTDSVVLISTQSYDSHIKMVGHTTVTCVDGNDSQLDTDASLTGLVLSTKEVLISNTQQVPESFEDMELDYVISDVQTSSDYYYYGTGTMFRLFGKTVFTSAGLYIQ